MNLARLNHLLIPATKAGRDRFRKGPLRLVATPASWIFRSFTEEGRYLAASAIVAAILGFNVERAPNSILFASMASILLVGFGYRVFRRTERPTVEVSAPRLFEKGRPTRISVRLEHPTGWPNVRVERPLKPWDGQWVGRRPGVVHLPPNQAVTIEFEAVFNERGTHHLDPFIAAPLHPFRVSQGPTTQSRGLRFTVVPRPANVASITIGGHRISGQGEEQSVEAAPALDFIGVRPYRPGDRLRDLHALRSARIGEPIVREYGNPTRQRIGCIVILDASARQGEATLALTAGVLRLLSRDQDPIIDVVISTQPNSTTIGNGGVSFDSALEELGRVRIGRRVDPAFFDSARTMARDWNQTIIVTSGSSKHVESQLRQLPKFGVDTLRLRVDRAARSTQRASSGELLHDDTSRTIDPRAIFSGRSLDL